MLVLIILLIAGLCLLISGAHFLVNGASSLAKRLSVSETAIGLTLVAFGTSTPELMVNIFSSLSGHNEIVFGNIIGSNTFNILVVLSISGIVFPLTLHSNTVWKEIPFSLFAVLLLFVLVNDALFFNSGQSQLSSIDGFILLGSFIVFLIYVFGISRIVSANTFTVKIHNPFTILFFIIIGFTGLFIGGRLVVDNSISIAQYFSVSERLIAITIVAGGTSLPELATSVVAACKKRTDIAIGNVIGSNIFNIYFILGVSSLMKTADYNPAFNVDLVILIAATIVLFITMFTGTNRKLDRWEAIIFIIAYIGYLFFLFCRR